jgi:hypothetical protein
MNLRIIWISSSKQRKEKTTNLDDFRTGERKDQSKRGHIARSQRGIHSCRFWKQKEHLSAAERYLKTKVAREVEGGWKDLPLQKSQGISLNDGRKETLPRSRVRNQ